MAPPAVSALAETTGATPGGAPSTAISARLELGAAACALAGGILAAAAGPQVTFGVLGVLLGIGVFAVAAYRPVFATYAYLGTLPVIGGIDPGDLIPLVAPNEVLLALLLAGAIFGGFLRYCRGVPIPFRLHRLDVALAAVVLLSTMLLLTSLMLRGALSPITAVVAILPIGKLVAIYLLVRFTIATEAQLVRCFRLIVWPGALVAMIVILQPLQFGPVPAFFVATGDYIVICLVLVLCCGTRGLLGRRERLALGLVLGTGVLAAGFAIIWIPAAVAGVLILWRLPVLRRRAVRFLWVVPIAVVVGVTAFIGWLEGFARYLPYGWIGGLALLAAFGWLSVAVLRTTRELTSRSDAVGVTASALEICWWVLLVLAVIDPYLTLRGTGGVLVMMLAITAGCGGSGRTPPATERPIVRQIHTLRRYIPPRGIREVSVRQTFRVWG